MDTTLQTIRRALSNKLRTRVGLLLFLIISLLAIFGVLETYSSSGFIREQAIFNLLNVLIFLGISTVSSSFWKKVSWPMYFICIMFLLLTLQFGIEIRGATRWLKMGKLWLNMSYLSIISVILLASTMVDNWQQHGMSFKHCLYLVAVVAIPTILLFMQSSAALGILLVAVCLLILFVADVKIHHLLIVFTLLSFIGVFELVNHWRLYATRISAFINPQVDPLGCGYQPLRSFIAIKSGGILGKGFCKGTAKTYVPFFQTDFVFAGICEEFGLWGGIILILLYFLLFLIGWRISLRYTKATFEKYITVGISIFFLVLPFFHVGANLLLLPPHSAMLPFISHSRWVEPSFGLGWGIIASCISQYLPKNKIDSPRYKLVLAGVFFAMMLLVLRLFQFQVLSHKSQMFP